MPRGKSSLWGRLLSIGWAAVGLFACGGDPKDGPQREVCDNGADDDGNGVADCIDSACVALCAEVCDNGIDDNGDWLVDCGDPGCVSTCDGDGDGGIGALFGGDDCDDTEASIAASLEETYYDGLDNDCDPATVDDNQDGDGERWPEDCDDANASVFSGAPEICGDGVANDCAGAPVAREQCFGVRSLASADHWYDGSEAEGYAGTAVAAADDPDRDGNLDLIFGAPGVGVGGAAYVLEAPFPRSGDLRSVACELVVGIAGADFGYSVGNLDAIDVEQGNEVGIGSRFEGQPGNRSGAVYVLGPTCTPGAVQGSAFELSGVNKDEFGTSFASIGDVSADGVLDIAVGAPRHEEPVPDAGSVLIFAGPVNGPKTPEDAWAELTTDEELALLGQVVVGTGDLDGDGRDDLAVGAPLSGSDDAGKVYAVTGAVSGSSPVSDHAVIDLGADGDQFGLALGGWSGDLTGDGGTDLVVGVPLSDRVFVDAGIVVVIDDIFTANVAATLEGEAAGDGFGLAVTMVRDLDGDGARDLAVGAPYRDASVDVLDAGAVYVWFGPLEGRLPALTADVTLLGEADRDFAGLSVASAGDIDADGYTDLLVGAPYHDGSFPGAGRVYLFTFGY